MKFDAGSNRRGENAGRRHSDSHVCVFHYDERERVEKSINKLIEAMNEVDGYVKHMVENVDNKFIEMAKATMSYKAAAIIASICAGLFAVVFGLANYQLVGVSNDVKELVGVAKVLEDKSDAVMIEQVRVATIQNSVVKTIDDIRIDQKKLEAVRDDVLTHIQSVREEQKRLSTEVLRLREVVSGLEGSGGDGRQ